MAIVMEFTHPNGCHVIVRDDCYRDLTKDEIDRRRRALGRTILTIDREIQKERMKDDGNTQDK